MFRRVISLLLALVLLVGTVPPVQVRAEETVEETVAETVMETVTETTEGATVPVETLEPAETVPENETPEESIPEETQEPVSADAANGVIASGSCDSRSIYDDMGNWIGTEYIIWTLYDDGLLEFSVTLTSPEYTGVNWTDYPEQIKKLVIPFDVDIRLLYGNWLSKCPNLTEAILGLEEIPRSMFSGCANLEKVTLLDTVIMIGDDAFWECKKLANIIIPESVGIIGNRAFYYCESLQKFVIPDSVISLGEGVFWNCYNLTSVILPSGMTVIPRDFFSNCKNLTSIVLPEGIRKIDDYAFNQCAALTQVNLPEGLEEIGSAAFQGCKELRNVVLPESLTTIGTYAFNQCDAAWEIVEIPAAVTSIGDWAFQKGGYYKLRKAYRVSKDNACYSSDAQGVLFDKDQTVLMDAPVLLSGVYAMPSTVRTIRMNAFIRCELLTEVRMPDGINSIGTQAFYYCKNLTKANIPASLKTIEDNTFNSCPLEEIILPEGLTKIGRSVFTCYSRTTEMADLIIPASVQEIGASAFLGSTPQNVYFMGDAPEVNLVYSWDSPPFDGYTTVAIDGIYHRDAVYCYYSAKNKTYTEQAKANLAMEGANWVPMGEEGLALTLLDFVDNGSITINGCGSAFAYYTTEPKLEEGQVVYFTVDGEEASAVINSKGVFRVPLGSFDEPGEFSAEISVTKVDAEEVTTTETATKKAVVTVTPLTFTQEWEFSGKVGLEFSAGGVGAELGPFAAEASLGNAAVGGKLGSALDIILEYEDYRYDVKLLTKRNGELYANGSAGPVASAGIEPLNVGVEARGPSASAKVEGGVTFISGIEVKDAFVNPEKLNPVLGLYILDECIVSQESQNTMFLRIMEYLTDEIMDSVEYSKISGTGGGFAASGELNVLNLKINDQDVFADLKGEAELAISTEELRGEDGSLERSTSYKAGVGMGVLTGAWLFDHDLKKVDFLQTDLQIVGDTGDKSVSVTYQDTDNQPIKLLFGKHVTTDSKTYTFRDASLQDLMNRTSDYYDFLYGSKKFRTVGDVLELRDVLFSTEAPVAYTAGKRDEYLRTLDLNLGLKLGIGGKVGISLASQESTNYSDTTGYLVDKALYITGESDDLETAVSIQSIDFWEKITSGFEDMKEMTNEFLEKVSGAIQSGLKSIWASIEPKVDSIRNFIVSITSPKVDTGAGMESFTIDTVTPLSRAALSGGIRNVGGDYSVSKAVTLGRPFIVAVTDGDTGEEIADFSVEPLEFTIRYAAEDLEAAGLSPNSDVVLSGGIAMYLYNEDGNYYDYVGGVNDLEAMSVTATITKAGQYILAVDACAPVLKSLDISDFRETPTITAYVDDLTGLDKNSFVFTLDGAVKVDGSSIADHYDEKSGLFTYTVPETEALAEGEHTMSFTLADTTGNTDTYAYSFQVDLTAPVVENVSVTGATNAGSVVEIRAQVSDENLTGVYARFSKRMSDGTWSSESGVAMIDMGDGFWGLDYEGDGSIVSIRVVAEDIGANTAESEAFEAYPYVEDIYLYQDYRLINVGETLSLADQFYVLPEALASNVEWSVVDGGEEIISVEDGVITALSAGTAWVIVSVFDGETTLSDRCRIDVADPIQIEGVQLSTDKVTTELYSNYCASFDILLMLPQNYSMNTEDGSYEDYVPNIPVTSLWFTDPETAELFYIYAADDRSAIIVPSWNALENSKAVKGSYVSRVGVMVQGQYYETDPLTLTVKKTLPKLKATIPAFNNFWSGQTQSITVTGATVTGISCDNLPDWLSLYAGDLSLTENVPAKGGSAKLTLLVEAEEWAVPVEVALAVKCGYKAPGLKLSASSVQMAAADSNGVQLQLLSKDKKVSLADLGITGITAPEGYSIADFNAEDGTFTLKAGSGFPAGKINLEVIFRDTEETVSLPLTVKTASVTLKLSQSSITLNSGTGDSAAVSITATPADYRLTAPNIRLEDAAKQDKTNSGELGIRFDAGKLYVSTTGTTPDNAKYTLYVSTAGGKEAALKITITDAEPTLKLKANGNLDLSFPDRKIALTTTFKNHSGGNLTAINYTVTEASGKTVLNEDSKAIQLTKEGSELYVQLKETEGINVKNTYTLNLKLTLEDGSTLESIVKIPVKQTNVSLKLSANKLTLNKAISDKASVAITCATKDYAFTAPVWQLTDSKGNDVTGQLDITWTDGKLTVATTEATPYGGSYKLQIAPEEGAKAVTLAITIPAENKSSVTGTLKATGSLDVIRDGTALTVTPTWKNCSDAERTEELKIFCGNEDVTASFNIDEEDGKYILTRAGALDHSRKYTATLTAIFANGETAEATGTLKLKQGSAKLTLNAGNTTLFTNDKHSRVEVFFTSADAALNGVAKIELDPKLAEQFEVFDYGNGTYAIGFKDGKIPAKITSANIALNVWLEGNETAKANASVKVKLSIVR